MMKRMFAAVAIAAVATVATLPLAQAATPASQDQQVLKKKKAAAKPVASQKKPADARKAAKVRIISAKKANDPMLKLKAGQADERRAVRSARMVNGRPCTGFLQCLFGAKRVKVVRNPNIQPASLVSGGATRLSGMTTSETVAWTETRYPVGSIVVRTPERALYYISGEGEAIRYSVGVGRDGFQWSGSSKIVRKQEWPSWTPPKIMIEREAAKGHIIPDFMEGGPDNPLGARALYIGGTMFRVHGTNNEASIGGAVSSGCIRMMNADVTDLYDRVKIGARIYVYQ